MIEVRLPTDLAPASCDDLIRLGRDHDGGYLVSRSDVLSAQCLVGLGLNDDWSFEQGFTQLNDCDLIGYDGSVSSLIFARRFLRALRRRRREDPASRRLSVLSSYLSFFRGRREHRRTFVAAQPGPDTVPFADVAVWAGARRVFLKIDIEGAEYGILDGITALGRQVTGLVIEFHDCHQRLDQIRQFVRQIELTLVHVHANNHGAVMGDGLPQVIELTFSAATRTGTSQQSLPHVLDQPNKASAPDYAIRFADQPI